MTKLIASGIDFELVERKGMRNIRLVVLPPDGHVRVSAPRGADRSVIRSFVSSKADWIRARQQRYSELPAREPAEYADGDSFTLWGRPMRLRVVKTEGRPSTTLLEDDPNGQGYGVLEMRVPLSWGLDKRRSLFEGFLRRQMELELDAVVPSAEQRTGLHAASVSVRKMKSRWGSCSLATGDIRFALRLAEYPRCCLEMTVIHELGHLRFPDHGERFKAYMDEFCPRWREIRKQML